MRKRSFAMGRSDVRRRSSTAEDAATAPKLSSTSSSTISSTSSSPTFRHFNFPAGRTIYSSKLLKNTSSSSLTSCPDSTSPSIPSPPPRRRRTNTLPFLAPPPLLFLLLLLALHPPSTSSQFRSAQFRSPKFYPFGQPSQTHAYQPPQGSTSLALEQVLNFVRVSIQSRKVNLLSIDKKKGEKIVIWLPVDSQLRFFSVSVSGKDPKIIIKDPEDRVVRKKNGLEELVKLPEVLVLSINSTARQPGQYKLTISSSGPFTVRVTGLSSLGLLDGILAGANDFF